MSHLNKISQLLVHLLSCWVLRESLKTFENELLNLRVHGEKDTYGLQESLGDSVWCFPHISETLGEKMNKVNFKKNFVKYGF